MLLLNDSEHTIIKTYEIKGFLSAYLINENGQVLVSGDDTRGKSLERILAEYYKTASKGWHAALTAEVKPDLLKDSQLRLFLLLARLIRIR